MRLSTLQWQMCRTARWHLRHLRQASRQGVAPRAPAPAGRWAGATAAAAGAAAAGAGPAPDDGTINKQVLPMDAQLYSYLLAHTREPEVLRALRAATAERFPTGARMQVSPEQGAFLGWLVTALGVRRVIEVGVFTGYSSIAMALALPPGGELLACDRDPAAMALAREYWQLAGVADKVTERLGPAADTLAELEAGGGTGAGAWDFGFIDADKRGYRGYYEALLRLLRPGGTIAIDNVLWYGKVADPGAADKATLALRELNDFLVTDERVTLSYVPIGDGMALCTKR